MTDQITDLQLKLLGPPEIFVGDKLLAFPTRKTLALLIYLAVEGGQQPREHLATMLWPESSAERSHASLRNTLGHLQAALRQASNQTDNTYLSVAHTALALNPDAPSNLDLHIVERAYRLARADRSSRTPPEDAHSLPLLMTAARAYRGDFLVGFSLSDAPTFDDWAANQREVWRRRLSLIFDRLSEIQFAQGDFADTADTASRWIALDQLNEAAYRRKMRAHFAAGERGQALETYELCQSILDSELGIQPEPDTQALVERIRTQHPLKRATPQTQIDTPIAFLESLFAGRSTEHQVLVKHYEQAVTGQPQIVILRGEAGIGKSRLSREFMQWISGQDTQIIQGRAFESGSLTQYQPLVEAIRPLFEQDSILINSLDAAVVASLSQLLPELRNPELSGADLRLDIDRAHLFESLVRLTLALAERSPLVLFLDDLQWADRTTLDWLVYAIRRWRENNTPILLLISLRTESLKPAARLEGISLIDWLAQVERELKPYHLELSSLSHADTVEMLLSILNPALSDFAEWVFSETQGHPFYLMESLKDLLERRVLHPQQQQRGRWTFAVDSEHDLGQAVRVPSTARAVIQSRLSRLSPNAFSLLAGASILEQRLTFEHLCAIANISHDLGLPALDELVSGRLLVEADQPGDASSYVFANDMIRDVVYTEAGDARRRLFHRRALDFLEADRDAAPVLAHHAVAAGVAEAAFRHSLTAGQEALRLAAATEAQAHLEQARQFALEVPLASIEIESRIRDLYLQLAEAYELTGQTQQAQAVYEDLQHLPPQFPTTSP